MSGMWNVMHRRMWGIYSAMNIEAAVGLPPPFRQNTPRDTRDAAFIVGFSTRSVMHHVSQLLIFLWLVLLTWFVSAAC